MLWQWSKSEHLSFVSTCISYTAMLMAAHVWLTFRPLETNSGPDYQIQGQEIAQRPQSLWMNFHYYFQILCCYRCGFVSLFQMLDVSICDPSFHIVHMIKTWRRGLVKEQKVVKKSSTKTCKLWRGSQRGSEQHWESSIVKKYIPKALNTHVRCSPEVKKMSLLCWDG